MKFRKLKAHEIEVRTQSISLINNQGSKNDPKNWKGAILLLYKDARCDMNILDETVGIFNWKREHKRENANCIVSIWDSEKEQWISKEDTGTESNTQAEKGLASDSFKRACFNWGIGRELYTSPFIWIPANKVKNLQYARYDCKEIGYDDNGNINYLVITSDNEVVYSYGTPNNEIAEYATVKQLEKINELFTEERIKGLKSHAKIKRLQDLKYADAERFIELELKNRQQRKNNDEIINQNEVSIKEVNIEL